MNLGMRLDDFDLVFKVHWTVTFYLKLLLIGLSEAAPFSHIDVLGEELVLLGVDHREGMDRNKNLVTITVDSY